MRDMRRFMGAVVVIVCLSVVLAGCGKKSAGSVVADLEQKVTKMESYQGSGNMIFHTGEEPQEYQVEVWYQNPNFYRISLTNEKKDISQIVLRNEEGVFVLTPHLKKSFRFQSEWPDNQSQVYLYQSLVQSIVADKERLFTTDKDTYVFDVLANYQNSTLARQKIWLNSKTFMPQHVEVSDADANVVVVVDFTKFEFNTKFDADSFNMQRNLTNSNMKILPTIGVAATSAKDDKAPLERATLGVIESSYTPKGVKKQDETNMMLGGEKAVMLRYTGTYHYTLVQSHPQAQEAVALPGTSSLIDLGYTFGVLTGSAHKTLMWSADGVEFKLSSGDLPQGEMIKVAMAVYGQMSK